MSEIDKMIKIVDGILGDDDLCEGCEYVIEGLSCDECRRKYADKIIKMLREVKHKPQTCRNCRWSQTVCKLGDNLPCHSYEPKEDAPSIDIEPKRGEWILLEPRYPIEQKVYWNKEQALADTKGNGARERRRCSCCGYTKSFMCHMKDEQIKLWNFCPNCGADMRERKDERDYL